VITRASYLRSSDWPTPARYLIAVGLAFSAAAVRGLLSTLWGDSVPFLMFVPAIVLSAWAGGFWPGMATTVVSAILANYFWLPPFYSFRLATGRELIALVIFIAIGAMICALSETMYRGRRRLEGLLHSIDEGFVVFDMDWRYRYVNERAAELLRQPTSFLLGKAIWDVFPDIAGTDIETDLRRASGRNEPVVFETFYKPHGRWFRTRVFPTPEGFSALLEDTTARKQADEAGLRLGAIVRSSEDAIVAKDLDGIITAWNPAAERLFGFTAEEAIGRSIRMIVPADRQSEEDEVLRRLRRGEAIEHMETVRVRKDGTPVDIALTVSPIRDAEGRIIGGSKIARDITERRRAEERLRVQHTVAQILAEAATIEEATPRILRAMGECLGWDVGALWRVDREAEALRCVELWHNASIEVPEFERLSRELTFVPDLGLPGRVWSSLEPKYIPDVVPDENFPRASVAEREGLHAAFGFPILLGGKSWA
jgi:PAS domain S-box-containing protein